MVQYRFFLLQKVNLFITRYFPLRNVKQVRNGILIINRRVFFYFNLTVCVIVVIKHAKLIKCNCGYNSLVYWLNQVQTQFHLNQKQEHIVI